MRFNDFKVIAEAQFNSKQEVIDHFVKQGKSAAAGASAWERGWRGTKPAAKKPTGPVRSYHDDLDDKRYGEVDEACWKDYKQIGMKKKGGKQVPNCVPKESIESLESQLAEAAIGTEPKRAARPGTRPERGHTTSERYKTKPADQELDEHKKGVRAHKYTKKAKGTIKSADLKDEKFKAIGPKKPTVKELEESLKNIEEEQFCENCGGSLAEAGKASRSLCASSKPDSELGASQLSSCKSQGLRAREGKKSHKIGKTRITMGGHKIKGKKYGGNIPDWSE